MAKSKDLVVSTSLLIAAACSAYAQSGSEDRAVAPFSRLVVRDGIDVYLTQAAEASLRVEVDGWELADIVTEVEGDTLTLSIPARRDGLRFEDHEATAYLGFVDLSSIAASGGSDIESRNDLKLQELAVQASGGSDVDLAVQAESLEFAVSGGSDVDLRGAAKSLVIEASGGSDVSAESFESERATVSVSGGSDVSVRATAALVLSANGGSDVSVYGNPAEKTVNNDRSSDVAWH